MKYSRWIGITAVIILITACFLPWTFHPDLNKNFTGFFSYENMYGKPGKVFIVLSVITVAFYLIPRVWAKRWNLLVTGMTVAYAIKSFIVFSSCYRGICPDRKAGIWLMLLSSIIILAMAVFTDMPLKETGKKEAAPSTGSK
jgi:hypothetical protein